MDDPEPQRPRARLRLPRPSVRGIIGHYDTLTQPLHLATSRPRADWLHPVDTTDDVSTGPAYFLAPCRERR